MVDHKLALRTLLISVLIVVAVAGCSAGRDEPASETRSRTPPTATEGAPGESAGRPVTARESRWVRRLSNYSRLLDRRLAEVTYRTRGVMLAFASLLRDCRPSFVAAGAPSRRFRPAYTRAAGACEWLRRAAGDFDEAAAAIGGDFEVAQMRIDAAFDAVGKGRARLIAAVRYAKELRTALPRS